MLSYYCALCVPYEQGEVGVFMPQFHSLLAKTIALRLLTTIIESKELGTMLPKNLYRVENKEPYA